MSTVNHRSDCAVYEPHGFCDCGLDDKPNTRDLLEQGFLTWSDPVQVFIDERDEARDEVTALRACVVGLVGACESVLLDVNANKGGFPGKLTYVTVGRVEEVLNNVKKDPIFKRIRAKKEGK